MSRARKAAAHTKRQQRHESAKPKAARKQTAKDTRPRGQYHRGKGKGGKMRKSAGRRVTRPGKASAAKREART